MLLLIRLELVSIFLKRINELIGDKIYLGYCNMDMLRLCKVQCNHSFSKCKNTLIPSKNLDKFQLISISSSAYPTTKLVEKLVP